MEYKSLQLFVGIGNPDKNLLSTRHNVGFWFLDLMSEKLNQTLKFSKKYNSEVSEFSHDDKKIILIKPLSYVNQSGEPIKKILGNSNFTPENMIVIYDDLDLVNGKIRLRFGGGSGGHNGLNSIIEKTGSKNFWRLRIGIGKPDDKDKTVPYVLGKPTLEQKREIIESMNLIINNINLFLENKFSELMNHLNGEK
ncbi:MAG: aminoacyl-tRNA hydrolase [Gammaproteobacteria bacterium]|nr:aminoacyl-tRNA hydrolase [Gammaproteobacteria bacterium]|tara:strand:+ start:175299 stop:175883 length:585 start_codon:yes stop_codon:yes gene_type:complete